MSNTATFVKQRNASGDGRVYRLAPPFEGNEYVWVSAVNDGYVHETYIFASNQDGDVLDWSELEGSYKGGTDHSEALRGMGYEVIA